MKLGESAVDIPALGGWGLAALGSLLALTALAALRRRRVLSPRRRADDSSFSTG